MRSEPASALFTTAITEAELLYGIALLPEGKRRQSLESVVDLIFRRRSGGSCSKLITADRGLGQNG
jgi:predicted nucleic acid-binding protein